MSTNDITYSADAALGDTMSTDRHAVEKCLIATFRRTRAPEDFEPLIDLCTDKVRGVVYRIVLNRDDMNDLVQDAFVKAYQKFDSFRGHASFSTWVCQIAVNTTLNFVRKRKRIVQADQFVYDNQTSRTKENPDKQLIRDEERALVDRAIELLPVHLRTALVLSVIEKMETDEVAVACGCNKATVYWRLHKARKELKKMMKNLGAE